MVRADFYNNIMTDETIDMMLRQIDADAIVSKTGQIGRVKFRLEGDACAEYMYEITEDGEMYMQRLSPIMRNMGRISDVTDMVKEITYDLRNYKHALEAGLFDEYRELAENLNVVGKEFEDLFLMCNPKEGALEEIRKEVTALQEYLNKVFF